MEWKKRYEKRQKQLAKAARLRLQPWREDWPIRRERLEKERNMSYRNIVIDFDDFISAFLDIRKEFPQIGDFGMCGIVGEHFLKYYNPTNTCEIIWSEDLSDIPENINKYTIEIIKLIAQVLDDVGMVGIHLNNYKSLEHIFVLIKTTEGIYRLEGYSNMYVPRIVSWDRWKYDIGKLLTQEAGAERMAFWEGLFSVRIADGKDNQREFEVKLLI